MIENKLKIETHPGPQKNLIGFNLVFVVLLTLVFVFLLLTIYAIAKDNLQLLPNSYKHYFVLVLIDSRTACSLLVSVIGLLLVRYHFVIGFRPIVVYHCQKSMPAHPYLKDNIVWQVIIENVGTGTAKFTDIAYRISSIGVNDLPYKLSVHDIIRIIKQQGLVFEKDYYIDSLGSSFTLQSKEKKIIFEIKLLTANKLVQLDMKVLFKGLLGGKYQKEIYMIPRLGIPDDAEQVVNEVNLR